MIPSLSRMLRSRLVITGVVQGVGFRPFVYRLAQELGLRGWVLNSTEGVVVEAEGDLASLNRFVAAILAEAPPLARIDKIERVDLPTMGYTTFIIEESHEVEGKFGLVSPDMAMCDDCLAELLDPADRRYRYPFINCTNCGPRFTIIQAVPYDRPQTTMACFSMCPECEREYHDPSDRRFHAQPVACPVCGPRIWLQDLAGSRIAGNEGLELAGKLLQEGAIVAVKGLGGFHVACDAGSDQALANLRARKRRTDKPFAVMVLSVEVARELCFVDEGERRLLESPQRPIVLLRKRTGSQISHLVAPGNAFLGVMLPYTPLHHLLMERHRNWRAPALVMTSGNLSDEPIVGGNREAVERLGGIADAFLMHDRDIEQRCDDSVTRVFQGKEALVRRSRGHAPFPVRLSFESKELLACGGELKNSFAITKGSYVFLSQHIGDMENVETLASFERSVEHFRSLFRLQVAGLACDKHPGYLSSSYAREAAQTRGLPLVEVQHHHAHIAACLAENGEEGPAIGVAFDGTGYGDDGNVWGGEFLFGDLSGYQRVAHLKYVPLPGGEAAIRRPSRMAASYLVDAFGAAVMKEDLPPLAELGPTGRHAVSRQIASGLNSPLTSSAGRLFDAVSSLIGLRHAVNYEGQAAIELEGASAQDEHGVYVFRLLPGPPTVLDFGPAIRDITADLRARVAPGTVAARFHNTVAAAVAETCQQIRAATGLSTVALSGGVFQNLLLLDRTCRRLEGSSFRVLTHHQVPANDGGLALGQAVVASRLLAQTD